MMLATQVAHRSRAVRGRRGWIVLGALWVGCAPDPACPLGEIRKDGHCERYVASDPIPSGDAWQPAPGTSWHWQLDGVHDTSLDVAMFDIDLFDTPDAVFDALQDRVVVCYLSAGTREAWRHDASDFPQEALGEPLPGWKGERWLDITHSKVRRIMGARLDLAVERGCDGVEPDNVDGYANHNGVRLNATEQLEYNRWFADEAHRRGLSVGLKNDLDQVPKLVDWFDWALNEECAAFHECGVLATFTERGKAAFHVEYVDRWSQSAGLADEVCGVGPSLDTLIKTWDLGPEFLPCPG
jgi:hypothetical protein